MRLLHDRIIVLITLVALFVAGAIPFAHGQGFESALEGFAADSYSDTDTAISAVAAAMCQAFSPIPDGAGKARNKTNTASPTTKPIAWRRCSSPSPSSLAS